MRLLTQFIMSTQMRRQLPFMRKLMRMSDRKRRALISICPKELMDCFCECAVNILKGNVPLTPRQMSKLRREKHNLRELAKKKTPVKEKKKILQKGGFLSALLAPTLSLLGSVLLPHLLRQ